MIKSILCIFVAIFLLNGAFAKNPLYKNLQHRVGSATTCYQGRQYILEYNTIGVENDSFIPLDQVDGLISLQCNLDHTQTMFQFSKDAYAQAFMARLTIATSFTVEEGDFVCVNRTNPVRRVMGWEYNQQYLQVLVMSVPARYDEIFQDADVNVTSVGPCGVDKQICIGMNADTSTCNSAAGPIPIYSNDYLSIECSNCFLGFEVDVFLQMSIRWFHLHSLAAGFRNMGVNGAMVFDMQAHTAWSAGISKQLQVVQPKTILSFHIGVIPIKIWFEVPVQLSADANFQTSAQATVGALASWNLGDLYISWDEKNHWQHVTPHPVFAWSPSVSGSAQFDALATFTLAPSLVMHVDNVVSYSVNVVPKMMLDVKGNVESRQICTTASADLALTSESELDINISWLHVHTDKTWGPKTIYDSGEKQIFSYCANV